MRFVFRTDSSFKIGTGHVMRCITLADELARRGHDTLFVCRDLAGNINTLIQERGHDCHVLPSPRPSEDAESIDENMPPHAGWLGVSSRIDASETIDAIKTGGPCDWLIIDHYAIDVRWASLLRGHSKHLMSIDDLADRAHDCDLLLDQNLYPDMASRYEGLLPDTCRTLLGPQFALLRPEFARAAQNSRVRSGTVRRVLVFFGGVDATNETMKALDALSLVSDREFEVDVVIGASNPHRNTLQAFCVNLPKFRLHVQTDRVADLMREADLAIGAGGVVTWERCAIGLPAIAWSIAENQRAVIEAVADYGAILAPDEGGHGQAENLLHQIAALFGSECLCRHIGQRAASVCDGAGARRVADLLTPIKLALREATSEDCEALYRWRNHPTVRAVSTESQAISFETHKTWFESGLRNPKRTILIAEQNGIPAGVLRFDFEDAIATISLYLVPGSAGKGIGTAMLNAGEAWLRENHPEIITIGALVLEHNSASKALFEKNGFVRQQITYEKVLDK